MSDQGEARPTEPLSVYQHILAMTEGMATLAWQKLGLQPDMMTGQIHTDLVEAKVAIDLVAHLATFVEPQLDEEDKREVHNLVRNLRINYVQKSQETGG